MSKLLPVVLFGINLRRLGDTGVIIYGLTMVLALLFGIIFLFQGQKAITKLLGMGLTCIAIHEWLILFNIFW